MNGKEVKKWLSRSIKLDDNANRIQKRLGMYKARKDKLMEISSDFCIEKLYQNIDAGTKELNTLYAVRLEVEEAIASIECHKIRAIISDIYLDGIPIVDMIGKPWSKSYIDSLHSKGIKLVARFLREKIL